MEILKIVAECIDNGKYIAEQYVPKPVMMIMVHLLTTYVVWSNTRSLPSENSPAGYEAQNLSPTSGRGLPDIGCR